MQRVLPVTLLPVAFPSTAGTRARLLRRAAIATGLTMFVVLAASYLTLLLRGTIRPQQSDFLVYYSAAHLVAAGHGGDLYRLPVLHAVEHGYLGAHGSLRQQAAFLYPPFMGLILAPLAAVPFDAAFLLWLAFNAAALAVAVALLARSLQAGREGTLLLAAAALAALPVFAALTQGQASLLLLAALTGALACRRAGHEVWAGILLAALAIKPPYLLPILLVLLLQRRTRTLAALSATLLALTLLPLPILGTGIDRAFLGMLRQAMGWHTHSGGFSPAANLNLAGSAALLLAAPWSTIVQAALSLGALLLLARVALRAPFDLTLAAAVSVGLLINPHVLLHDLALLLLPAAVAVSYRRGGPPHLIPVLAVLCLAPYIGIRLVTAVPVQLPALAGIALLWWLHAAGTRAPAREGQTASISTIILTAPRGVSSDDLDQRHG